MENTIAMNEKSLLNELKKPLNIDDVDFRIQSINKGGYATILAYKDARVDMNRLDEVCGTNWQDKYELIDGQLFCSIGIKIGDEWIWRQDVGTESYTEKTKGRASDAFKRAGFRWGIGRELYDYPLIQVKLNTNEYSEYQGKMKQTYNLKLKDWKWKAEFVKSENGPEKLTRLTAHDENNKLRFDSSNGNATNNVNSQTEAKASNKKGSNEPAKELPWLNKMDKNKNFTKEWLNVIEAINKGTITEVSKVREHYKVSKELAVELQTTINLTPAA